MGALLSVEMTLTPNDSKRHFRHKFLVEKSINVLVCKFSYAPKELNDTERSRDLVTANLPAYLHGQLNNSEYYKRFLPLKNLLTVSIDDPADFRGAVHRQDPEQRLFITRDTASPGLLPGQLSSGEWTITVSAHCVITDVCRYHLQVWSEDVD